MRSGFASRQAAEHALADELAALAGGAWFDDRNLTLGTWLRTWLTLQEQAERSPKTIANYRGHVRDVWEPALGTVRLRDLRRVDLEQVLIDLLKTQAPDASRSARPNRLPRTVRTPVAPGATDRGNVGRRVERRTIETVLGYHRTLRSALSVAQRRGLITVNPALGRIDALPSLTTGKDREPAVWEPAQMASFLEHVTDTDDRLATLFEVAAYTGLRRGELCGLRWSDLDTAGSGLNVRQNLVEVARDRIPPTKRRCPTCDQEHVGRMFKGPKSRAGRRWVPLAGPVRDALDQHQDRQAEFRQRPEYRDHDLVFCTSEGDPLRPSTVTAQFTNRAKTCGLPEIRLHDMRHGACSLLLAGGVPIEVVQMILGHASANTTRRVYAHLMRETTTEQVEQATRLLTRHRPRNAAQAPREQP